MKEKKSHQGRGVNMLFLLFYSPRPQSQVRILIYRNWPIEFLFPESKELVSYSENATND